MRTCDVVGKSENTLEYIEAFGKKLAEDITGYYALLTLEAEDKNSQGMGIKNNLKKNWDNDSVELCWMPEYTDIETCCACDKKFRITDVAFHTKRCPRCGQLFNIEIFIT